MVELTTDELNIMFNEAVKNKEQGDNDFNEIIENILDTIHLESLRERTEKGIKEKNNDYDIDYVNYMDNLKMLKDSSKYINEYLKKIETKDKFYNECKSKIKKDIYVNIENILKKVS